MVGTFPWHRSFSRIRLMYWNAENPFWCLTALPQCLHRWGWLLRIRFVLTETAIAAKLLLFVAWVGTCAWNCALPALCSPPCTGNVLCSSLPHPSIAIGLGALSYSLSPCRELTLPTRPPEQVPRSGVMNDPFPTGLFSSVQAIMIFPTIWWFVVRF